MAKELILTYTHYWLVTGILITLYCLNLWQIFKSRLKRDDNEELRLKTLLIKDNSYDYDQGFIYPQYATNGSSGMDIYLQEDLMIHAKSTVIVGTKLKVAIPEGYELQIRSRSGKGSKGLVVAQGIGTIDSDYRGEIKVALYNRTGGYSHLKRGEAIAQMVLIPVEQFVLDMVDEKSWNDLEVTDRGEGGFGSTDESEELNKTWD